MARLRYLTALLLALVALSSMACAQTCEVLCSENARYIDGCLEYWDAVWPDFGYDGLYDYDIGSDIRAQDPYPAGPSEEYIERCNERYSNAIRFGGPSNLRLVKIGCREDLTALAEASGCMDYEPNTFPLDPTEGENGSAPQPGEEGG